MNFNEVLIKAVQAAEEEYGSGQGELKKELAINIINNLVDIPTIPEILEEQIISVVIDLVVFIFNKYKLF